MLRTAFSRIVAAFRRRTLDDQLDEEFRAHLEMLAERFVARGMDPVDAAYAARRQFGGVTQMKEDILERRAFSFEAPIRDLRHALRQLANSKGFTASAVLTLALGIGATTAIFAVLDAVVLRPLPYANPDSLIAFQSIDTRGAPHPSSLSYPTFFDFRKQNRVFDHMISYRDARFTLSDSRPAIQVPGVIASWDLFDLLGVQPRLGRAFRPREDEPGNLTVVLGDKLWRTRFGADRGMLGRQIRMSGQLYTVVGIAPPGFEFPAYSPATQLWTSLSTDATAPGFIPMTEQRGARVVEVIARLKAGVSDSQAQAQMDVIARALAKQYPEHNKNIASTSVRPELDRLTARTRKPLWILLGAVMMVLLIGCGNVANLMLARATERYREFSLRTALGASRAAILGQMFVESVTIALLGAAGGIAIATAALKALLPIAGGAVPRLAQAAIDWRVLAFSAALALLTSILFGVAPAFQAAGADPAGALKEAARTISRGNNRFRSGLVVAEITLGLVLVVGAELLIASFVHLVQRNPGFEARHLLTFNIGLSSARYTGAGLNAVCDRLLARLRTIPGVQAAEMGQPLPLEGHEMSVAFGIENRPAAVADRPVADIAIVTPGFFRAMGIPLLKGREFNQHDRAGAPRVLIVNQAFANKFFPGENPIGRRIESGARNGDEGPRMREIVGVVGNATQVPLSADPDPIYYFPFEQLSWGIGAIVLRTSGPPLQVESAARAVLSDLESEAAMYQVRTGEERAMAALTPPRFLMLLMGSFAGIALLLTATGLYSVLSYSVAKRRSEIGVRIALGAGRSQVVGLVLRQAIQLVLAGLICGSIIAAASSHLLRAVLYGIRPGDPAVIAAGCGVLMVAGIAAAYIPAVRAASVEPIEALRTE